MVEDKVIVLEEHLISIIIPVFNAEAYLNQCLDSVINQTYANIEIICVDDGSTDKSGWILQDYAKKDNRIKVIEGLNVGVSQARNKGIEHASGRYLMFLDSDDWIETETCKQAMNWMLDEQADIVFWNYIREFDDNSKPQYIFGKKDQIYHSSDELEVLHRRLFGPYKEELEVPEKMDSLATVWGKLYSTDIIKKNNIIFSEITEVGAEDLLFNVHLFGFVEKAVYLCTCFNHYRKTNNSSVTQRYKKDFSKRLENLYEHLQNYIQTNRLGDAFEEALSNRKSLNIIGKGMNILRARGEIGRFQEIKKIVSSEAYRAAVERLELKYFPVHWKIFFAFAKYNVAFGVYIMLLLIKHLKEK